MRKPLISLALVAAQALTWATGSLYACIGADGSARIDGGPQHCKCGHAEQADRTAHDAAHLHSCANHSERACDQQVGDVGNAPSWNASPCDCQHLAMGETQTVMSRIAKVVVDPAAWTSALLTPYIDVAAVPGNLALFLAAGWLDAPSERLASLSTVVLRC